MKLVIGGYSQGKLEYAKKYLCSGAGLPEERVQEWNGELPDGRHFAGERCRERVLIINHFHLWVRECLQQGRCPEEEMKDFFEACPDCIVICDEIGNGIVPVDAFEREYRERTGRILIELAEKAEEVVRVICGLGQKIK